MNWLVSQLVIGTGFFVGVALVLAAVATGLSRRRGLQRLATLLCIVGLILIAISATPLPDAFYALAGFASLLWLVVFRSEKFKRLASFATALCAGCWVIGVATEVPWHQTPVPRPTQSRTVTVIADSVSAGMGEKDVKAWPALLAEEHKLKVNDLSQMGETTASALKRVRANPIEPGIVIVEIGGNDLLSSNTRIASFAADLDSLLSELKGADRQVVMFELPLPPFENRWGQVQRTLAKQHGVLLVPKRVFMNVLTGSSSTLDTIHLTPDGHKLMEQAVWNVIQPAYP